jgi:hypothetical protein
MNLMPREIWKARRTTAFRIAFGGSFFSRWCGLGWKTQITGSRFLWFAFSESQDTLKLRLRKRSSI